MATVNLLKASYNGKLGATYGTKHKAQNVICAIPFSHAPHNEKQTKSVRAFECVNRVASGMAKYFWYYLGLSDKKMLKHNAVASWLKPLLQNHEFNLSAITALVKDEGTASIEAARVNTATGQYAVEASFTAVPTPSANAQGALLLLDEQGKVIVGAAFSGASFAKAGIARLDPELSYYALLLRSDYDGKKWKPNSFRLQQCALV